MIVRQLFPISIYENEVSFSDEVLAHLKSLRQNKIIRYGSHVGNISSDIQVLNHGICKSLKEQVQAGVDDFTLNYYKLKFDGNFFVHRSWVLENEPGHESRAHTHPNSVLSGVLYLDTPKGSGDTQFDKPEGYHNWINTDTIRFMAHEWNESNCDDWHITPYVGGMLIFPSQLKHSVHINATKKSRWSLSFDCFIEGFLDSGGPDTRGPRITIG